MSGVGDTLRVLVLLLEHPDGSRAIGALSDGFPCDGYRLRARFEMDPSDRLWGVTLDHVAMAAFRSAARESDGYVVQREYVIGPAPYPDVFGGDPSWVTVPRWDEWLLGRLGSLLTLDPARWVQGQPAEGDTRLGPDGRRQRYTRGRWTETPLGVR